MYDTPERVRRVERVCWKGKGGKGGAQFIGSARFAQAYARCSSVYFPQ